MYSLQAIPAEGIYLIAQKLWWFLIVLGVLVTFHEFGHFLVARWAGVKVLKFSIGFGPKLVSRYIGETEYLLSAIPLGGYVKMFGEEVGETISPAEQARSFMHQPLYKRTLIVAAGPGFNFLLSYLIFTGCLAIGIPIFVPTFEELTPTIEAIRPGSPADQAGLQVGDRIVRVNGDPISTQNELFAAVAESKGRPLTLDVQRDSTLKTFVVTPEAIEHEGGETPFYVLGIEEAAPVVTSVLPNTPAMRSGLREGDRIVAIEGQPVATWSQMTDVVRSHPNEPLEFQVLREGARLTITVTPEPYEFTTEDGESTTIGRIGIMGPGRSVMRVHSPWLAPIQGVRATWGWVELTVTGIYKMLAGEISSKNIGGPLMIASMSGEAAEQGFSNVVFLVAILSINLGILNLLPIPILDGGHLFFFACEAILRRPLGERQREFAQQIGLVLLVGIMIYAFWNDIQRLLQ
ncbi:MAG: RIP metalloprotease RseP [Nitrospirae bacterium]|nr:MAG: RIP metalloprotease RseP [Nitrospirota bacterium]